MRLIFIGPRSVGKSTIGRALSEQLDLQYFDFDEFVEEKLNGIDQHIINNSLKSYRKEEEKLLTLFISELPNTCIFSVGGGTIASQYKNISKRNINLLKKTGTIVYLVPSENRKDAINILFRREKKRGGEKSLSETSKLFNLRESVYEKNFDHKFITHNKSPKSIIKSIISKIPLKK